MSDPVLVEQLVMDKVRAQQQFQSLLAVVGAVVLAAGKESKDGIEFRLTKTQTAAAADHSVEVRGLKGGGLVVEVKAAQ